MQNKELLRTESLSLENGEKILSVSKTLAKNYLAAGTSKGNAIIFRVIFNISFDDNQNRKIIPEVKIISKLNIDSTGLPVNKIIYRVSGENEFSIAALINNSKLFQFSSESSASLISTEEEKIYRNDLSSQVKGKISAIEMDDYCEKLMVGTESGQLYYISLRDKFSPQLVQTLNVTPSGKSSVTSLNFIIGDQSLIVGDADGNLTSWMRINDASTEYGWKLVNPHKFKSHEGTITDIKSSARNKNFITGSSDGKVYLQHLTSEQTLVELQGNEKPVSDLAFAPKGDGVAVLYEDGSIAVFEIESPHPEITLQTLFGKVWYEGYTEPEYVWQSTGGTDDFEPKFSLIPLILGTLKGTVYALLIAVPLALFGALYTSQFTHPVIKNIVKPTVEIMAALPSVVIGFLAGLWLAPLLERILPGVMLMFIIIPLTIAFGVFIWNRVPKLFKFIPKTGYEILLILPLIVIGAKIAIELGPTFESIFFGGDYRTWLSEYLNEQYDQRNSIVVGFAMGFAVIPIIFTICEDALSTVPQSLTSASLALGATRWQTALRIVLPSASPGIFSAVMIGFGRAIGETMIVLMATGNTPILDFSPFNGMRTLSANIAVEIPEAPYQGTLYRVLFLAATLLFVMTFIINTIAEIVRQRLRKKYSEL
ncbi:MAG: ABC transporter permease subunit [Ignavibacteriales bacterium]|nr:MAG: ABC transporter permease subunit [Ignavibacteriales bacterium]